jgi:arabinan endo-1,5-alpha-L-arabinosidase
MRAPRERMRMIMGRTRTSRMAVIVTLALTGSVLVGGAAAAVAASQSGSRPASAGQSQGQAARAASSPGVPNPYIFVHDPSMAREGGTYYLFSTGDPAGVIGNGNIQIRTSRNLRQWSYTGTVFATKPAWITSTLGSIPNLWAPDISFFSGLWHLYYAGSSFGSNNSVIGLATTPTLDPSSPRYHWTDRGLVFQTTTSDDFNAIDPSLVTAADGGKWLVLGSFWSGIKLLQLDATTGKPASSSPTVYSLAQRPAPDAEEGAGITYHDGYYYLFVSFDSCCQGIGSSYRIMVGRSVSVTGPYVDPNGTAMMNGGGMELQGSDEGMIGPGSSSIYQDGSRDYLVYHYYDAFDAGNPWVQVRPLVWLPSGWPVTGQPLTPVPGSKVPLG